MDKKRLKRIYFLPNVITAFGLSCGLFIIFKINMTDVGHVNYQILIATAALFLLACFADLIDGALARVLKAESEFGGIFDSMADAITFGVAPSVIILKTLSIPPEAKFSFLPTIAAIIYSLSGVLRLVRFNLSALEAKTNFELALANKKNFTGLPIPGAAAAAVSMNLFLFSDELASVVELSSFTKTCILSIVLIILGYCMISRWKFPSIKNLHIRVASFQMVILTVFFAVLLFYGVLHAFSLVFFILSWGYILLAWVLSMIRIIAGRKSKTLEDFEPEPDDLEEIDHDDSQD